MGEKLLKLLRDEQVITGEQYQQALQKCETFGESAERVLERMGILSEEQLLEFLGEKFRLPVVDWESYVPDQRLLDLISEQAAVKYTIFPFQMEQGKRQGKITLAVANPSNVAAVDDIAFMTGCTIKTCISSARAIRDAIRTYYSGTETSSETDEGRADMETRPAGQEFSPSGSGELDALLAELSQEAENVEKGAVEELSASDREHPSIRFLLDVLNKTVHHGVSEIRIEPYGQQERRVRLRRYGVLQEYTNIPSQLGEGLVSRLHKILQQRGRTEPPENWQKTAGRFSTILSEGTALDLTPHFYPTPFGESLFLKIRRNVEVMAFHELGFSEKSLKTLNRVLAKPQGLLLLMSPPGQGKTMTFHALLNKLSQGGNRVLSLEDVVKKTVPGMIQIPYSPETSFQAWCSILSYHAPHVLGVGQAERPMMKRLAFEFASSAFVLTSLTAKSFEDGLCLFISVLLDELGQQPSTETLSYLLDSLGGVIVQRLVRTICPNCKERQTLSRQDDEWLRQLAGTQAENEEIVAYAGKGCSECMETGYTGQTGVFEVIKIDNVLKNLLLQHYPLCVAPVRRFYAEMSPETFRHQAFQLIREGTTSLAEIRRMAS